MSFHSPAGTPLRNWLCAALLVPCLSACLPALVATGAGATLISYHDRRSTGTQAEDETSEWKARNRLPAELSEQAHANFTAFNRRLLITGEARDEAVRERIGAIAAQIEGIQHVYNELQIAPLSSLAARSQDALLSTRVKARLIEALGSRANQIKVVSEGGVVYLMGLVKAREAARAVEQARSTAGALKVVNIQEILSDEAIERLDAARLGTGG